MDANPKVMTHAGQARGANIELWILSFGSLQLLQSPFYFLVRDLSGNRTTHSIKKLYSIRLSLDLQYIPDKKSLLNFNCKF